MFLKLKFITNYLKFILLNLYLLSTPHLKTPNEKKTPFPYFLNREVQLYKTKQKTVEHNTTDGYVDTYHTRK